MIKKIREDYKKIEINKICPNDATESIHEKNLFNCIKKSFEIESKEIKKFKKRGSQIYTQKINLNNTVKINQKRNSVVLPKISSKLDLNKDDFIKNNFYNNNLYSSSSSSSSSSSFQSSSSSKRIKKNLPNNNNNNINNNINNNNDAVFNKYLMNVNNSQKLESKSGHINTNMHEFKIGFKPKKLPKIVNKRNQKVNLLLDYETTEFAKRITFNDPISNLLVNKQNQYLRKSYAESNLYKTLNKTSKSYKKKRASFT